VVAVSLSDWHPELRRRPRVRPDREGEGAANGVAVGGDHPPEDEVPALRRALEGRDERLRRAGRVLGRPRGDLAALRVGDGDDCERASTGSV
jgi:hypothetical protein